MFLANRKLPPKNRTTPTDESDAPKVGQKKAPGATEKAPARQKTGNDRGVVDLPNPEDQTGWSWEKSWAKEILREAIANNDITDEHTYDEIHSWHPEVEKTDRKKIPRRVRDLRLQIRADAGRAEADARALEHDRRLFPALATNHIGEPRWEGSEAQRLLRIDVKGDKHLTMKPAEFYDSREVYKSFSHEVIRSHIYQEIRLTKYYAWRNSDKKKKKAFRMFK